MADQPEEVRQKPLRTPLVKNDLVILPAVHHGIAKALTVQWIFNLRPFHKALEIPDGRFIRQNHNLSMKQIESRETIPAQTVTALS